jgi:hypothetical protein
MKIAIKNAEATHNFKNAVFLLTIETIIQTIIAPVISIGISKRLAIRIYQ